MVLIVYKLSLSTDEDRRWEIIVIGRHMQWVTSCFCLITVFLFYFNWDLGLSVVWCADWEGCKVWILAPMIQDWAVGSLNACLTFVVSSLTTQYIEVITGFPKIRRSSLKLYCKSPMDKTFAEVSFSASTHVATCQSSHAERAYRSLSLAQTYSFCLVWGSVRSIAHSMFLTAMHSKP